MCGLVMCVWFISLRHLLYCTVFLACCIYVSCVYGPAACTVAGVGELAKGHKRYFRITLHTN